MKLTDLEKQVINNFLNSEYQNYLAEEMPIGSCVWSFSVTDERKDLAGALGSLVKKGIFLCGKVDGDEICSITKKGVKLLEDMLLDIIEIK